MTGMHIAFQLVSQDTKTPNAVLQTQLVTAAVNSGLSTQSLATNFGTNVMGNLLPQMVAAVTSQMPGVVGKTEVTYGKKKRLPKAGEFCWRCGLADHLSGDCPHPVNPAK